ncbi:phosphate ABC transporter permease subunit PstC [Skermanella sp. TT6]|uniref:Phosphate transport system permease protein n=1 Tax=Skermanella cutis TaxID=2775420 RepID=A0ABX7B5P3_9PROT|nr:phosphate ABC transporter permease subunit PstC [Skermanella sp. TT6]QQP89695.1 phosphate ABC transporter permease subunit PstC [Skermanella sp. TT6]
MSVSFFLAVLAVLAFVGFQLGRSRAVVTAGGTLSRLHSVPSYYGLYVALWVGLPALILFALWTSLEGSIVDGMVRSSLPAALASLSPQEINLVMVDIHNLAYGNITSRVPDPALLTAAEYYKHLRGIGHGALAVVMLALACAGLYYARQRIEPGLRARNQVEKVVNVFLILCSLVAILTTVGIVLSLLFEAIRFFTKVSPAEFLFGLHWSPQTAIRADQVAADGSFGAVPLFTGTLLIASIAMVVAVPLGLMSAIYMSEYAPPKVRGTVKPVLEILAGIPTVVYGFFAALTMAPFVRDVGQGLGLAVSSESALAAGVVMGVMIIPFVSSLSDDIINAVPQSLRDGSYGLGATKSETIRQVVLPAALPGIVGGILLAVSRAIGETMIVVMAAGLAANLSANPLDAVSTVTVQIATLLVGDQEFDSAKTLSAFGLGLVLFTVTLGLNIIALRVVQKYREKYD